MNNVCDYGLIVGSEATVGVGRITAGDDANDNETLAVNSRGETNVCELWVVNSRGEAMGVSLGEGT